MINKLMFAVCKYKRNTMYLMSIKFVLYVYDDSNDDDAGDY